MVADAGVLGAGGGVIGEVFVSEAGMAAGLEGSSVAGLFSSE
jgi:hypothetical protein